MTKATGSYVKRIFLRRGRSVKKYIIDPADSLIPKVDSVVTLNGLPWTVFRIEDDEVMLRIPRGSGEPV